MPVKALICDDESPARAELRFLLEEAGDVEVLGEAADAQDALALMSNRQFDVIFLDIAMPGLSGIELAEVLAHLDRHPAVVFVTAHAEHAVEAFTVFATDFLLKPVRLERLRESLGRITPSEDDGAMVERIPVESSGCNLLLSAEDVFYVMAVDDCSYLHIDGDRYCSRVPLTQLEAKLEPRGFFRVHRRFLVNLAHVKEILPMDGGTMLLTLSDAAGTQVPVSRRRASALKRALGLPA